MNVLDIDAHFCSVSVRFNGLVQSPFESVLGELLGIDSDCSLGDEWFDDTVVICVGGRHWNYQLINNLFLDFIEERSVIL